MYKKEVGFNSDASTRGILSSLLPTATATKRAESGLTLAVWKRVNGSTRGKKRKKTLSRGHRRGEKKIENMRRGPWECAYSIAGESFKSVI